MPVTIDVGGTIAGLEALGKRVDHATRKITVDALHLFQLAGMKEAPVGVVGNSTNPPGDLARSIDVQGPRGGDGLYEGEVGPTVVYGRQRELGGDIYPKLAKALHFWTFGIEVYTLKVHQEGAHYLEKGYVATLPSLEPMAASHILEAILGTE